MLVEKEVFPFFTAMKRMLLLPYLLLAQGATTGKEQQSSPTYCRLRHTQPVRQVNLFSFHELCSRWLTNNIFGSTEVRKTVSGERNRIHKEQSGFGVQKF